MPQLDPPGQGSMDPAHSQSLIDAYDTRPNPQALTGHDPKGPDAHLNSSTGVDYEPHPDRSLPISAARQSVINAITGLYSSSASEEDIMVYARDSVYDDPWSYCDTRYKIAGQWWGIPLAFATTKVTGTEVVESTPTTLIFKMRCDYTMRLLHTTKPVNSLITLTLDPDPDSRSDAELAKQGTKAPNGGVMKAWMETVRYHKDMWNEKDYSHEGFAKTLKTANGDHLTKITAPPKWL